MPRAVHFAVHFAQRFRGWHYVNVDYTLKLVVIGSFENAAAALEYMHKAQASAPREVVPWLPANKYSFLIISGPNLELLLNNKDMPAYRRFNMLINPNDKH